MPRRAPTGTKAQTKGKGGRGGARGNGPLGPRGGVEIGVVFRGRYAILPQSFALVFCEFPGVFQNLQSLVGVFFASLRFASG